jgi:hypothetical protein
LIKVEDNAYLLGAKVKLAGLEVYVGLPTNVALLFCELASLQEVPEPE